MAGRTAARDHYQAGRLAATASSSSATRTWLEWGYRLVPECRGLGYATEASQALLARAHQTYAGDLLAIMAPENLASRNVCRKLGFTFWKRAPVEGDIRNLYTRSSRRTFSTLKKRFVGSVVKIAHVCAEVRRI
jgi:RimJ/RimL family protein N-acetyltransferase